MVQSITSQIDAKQIKKGRAKASKALSNARQRCENKKNKDYANYGGIGIQVLIGLDDLIAAIGLPPSNASLDRIDPNGHYEAGNIRWATKSVQAANKKSSLAGSTLPLHLLISQSKVAAKQEKQRPKVAEAWALVIKAFNYGTLSEAESSQLAALLGLIESPQVTFQSRPTVIGSEVYRIFPLPSLTLPNGLALARGKNEKAPEVECARRYGRQGLLFRLRHVEVAINLPTCIRLEVESLLKGDRAGLTLVGRPTHADLKNGWFEIWMLAAASRLTKLDVGTALFPAMTCIELLQEFGGQHNWDDIPHPLLDLPLLFIPDFQLDCGPWGNLTTYQFGSLERLLRYRAKMGHKTVVGIQAPSKLTSGLKNLLLADFNVCPVANGTLPENTAFNLGSYLDIGKTLAKVE